MQSRRSAGKMTSSRFTLLKSNALSLAVKDIPHLFPASLSTRFDATGGRIGSRVLERIANSSWYAFVFIPSLKRYLKVIYAPQWDFSSGTLHRPRLQSVSGAHAHRNSISSQYSLALRGTTGRASLDIGDPFVSGAGFGFGFGFAGAPRMSASKYHPAPSRNEVAVVQPVLVSSGMFRHT